MKKFLKFALAALGVVIVIFFLLIFYVLYFLPRVPVENIKVEITPERIERGKYLAENVAQCIDCHSTRDWSKFSGPAVPGTEGKGGEAFDRKFGFPGAYYAPNITPFHLKDWSDGEVYRAITSGISKDGRALFPIMPYPSFGKMDKEDIYSIIAYIRSLPSIENTTPESESDFPMNIIINTIPSESSLSPRPAPTDTLNYGKYLVNAASCAECHTPANRGQIIEDLMYSGGRYFEMPQGTVISKNITPDKQTGIGNWTREDFITRFKAFENNAHYASDGLSTQDFNTIMPWANYAKMTEEDLGAIYAYLMSVKPISNKVEKVFIKK
ncbi:MAG TPA: c-type cytochrome [Pyrinomonadaceae bacterium]|nr:c-type cytochrome [Pyrinomonadaceae bacterium]